MVWLIALTVLTYLRSLANTAISDDITVHQELAKKGYPVRWKDHIRGSPQMILHDLMWRWWKDKWWIHHLVNLVIYIILVCSLYIVGQKYFPEPIVFWACMFFIVHPCNCQSAGWISGRYYMFALILGLWALYFNETILYFLSVFCQPTIIGLVFFMDIKLWVKVLSILFFLYLSFRAIGLKEGQLQSEGWFKIKNFKLYPRKVIVALKSFTYYFTFAMFPLQMGWFHEMGEPIDEKLESWDFHATLCVLFIGTLVLFIGTPLFTGILLFIIFIAPFTNLVTPALFTSERYMSPALIGWSLFLSFLLRDFPIAGAVVITAYFMRTQLELWAYQDDFHLALYSLLNFKKSGFAWCNIVNYFMHSGRPSAAFDMVKEIQKRLPEFPTSYYQMYLMYRAVDLLNDMDKAIENLEKACRYGQHKAWYEELDKFKFQLKQIRLNKFRENVKHQAVKRFGPVVTPSISPDRQVGVGVAA